MVKLSRILWIFTFIFSCNFTTCYRLEMIFFSLAGVYCCGPAPVLAIKEGDLAINYDVQFVFAEVNADVIYYVEQKDGTVRQTKYTAQVGQNISTKAVGKDSREDITHNYKYPEGECKKM